MMKKMMFHVRGRIPGRNRTSRSRLSAEAVADRVEQVGRRLDRLEREAEALRDPNALGFEPRSTLESPRNQRAEDTGEPGSLGFEPRSTLA